jgi:hypothetical protein
MLSVWVKHKTPGPVPHCFADGAAHHSSNEGSNLNHNGPNHTEIAFQSTISRPVPIVTSRLSGYGLPSGQYEHHEHPGVLAGCAAG